MTEIFKHDNFIIKEERISMQDSTDEAITIKIETKNEEFIYTFIYGNLISFVRCKK